MDEENKDGYDAKKIDIFSLGCIFFKLLSGVSYPLYLELLKMGIILF
jgi:hypothetical protein